MTPEVASAARGLSYLQVASVLMAIFGGHLSVLVTEGLDLSIGATIIRVVTTWRGSAASLLFVGAAWCFLLPQSAPSIVAVVAGGIVCAIILAVAARGEAPRTDLE